MLRLTFSARITRHGFKLVGVEPRAAYLAGRRGATDAMVFYKDTREARRGGRARQVGDAGEEEGESEHDLEMMVAAEELAAQAAEVGEVPVGAIVVSPEGKIIGKGRNSMVGSNNPCAHAEVLAIQVTTSLVVVIACQKFGRTATFRKSWDLRVCGAATLHLMSSQPHKIAVQQNAGS